MSYCKRCGDDKARAELPGVGIVHLKCMRRHERALYAKVTDKRPERQKALAHAD